MVRLVVLATLLTVTAGRLTAADADDPVESMRSQLDLIDAALAHARSAGSAGAPGGLSERLFDWPHMAETVLRQHGPEHSAAERVELSRLLAEFLARVYTSTIDGLDPDEVHYAGHAVEGERIVVKTRIVTASGEIAVDYAARLIDGQRWRVEDVRIGDVSLVENSRLHLDTLVSQFSYETLLEGLRRVTK